MKKISLLLLLYLSIAIFAQAQIIPDSIKAQQLREISVTGQKPTIGRLAKEQATFIFSGKKTEVIELENLDVNITEKTPRQLFAKVPGVFVYDMDGSGNQVNIATRGLDPHRGWEFNIRKNGIITNSDMYGYPASHYSMPMEAVQRIEIVRGTGSLQYGAQFGGMLNYVSKQPDTTKAIGLESITAAGSFGLLSSYNAISGTVGKFSYYAYYSRRGADGYRDNSRTNYDAQGVILRYQPTRALKVTAEFARSNYIYQIPGPLTDSMFQANPRMATRRRNYFNPAIYVPSFTADYQLSGSTQLQWTTSAVLGNRNSVQFDKPANIIDRIDPQTLQYAPRQVDIDQFHSYTSELRLRHRYHIGSLPATLVTGLQLMRNNLYRSQLGKGTTGTDFDLTISPAGWGRDLHFNTKNIAFFAENRLLLSPKFSLSPGIRVESGHSDMNGQIANYEAAQLPNTIKHRFPLLGINADYEWRDGHNFYAGFSQAYRPVIFKDIIPASTFERADKNLQDATGYNLEAGYRGQLASFTWDISLFQLRYNNRLGSLMQTDEAGDFYILRTNTGNSLTRGLEFFTEYQQQLAPGWHFSAFTSTSFMEARYLQAQVRQGNENVSIKGNQVEGVPQVISRNGITIRHQPFSLSVLYSYTARSYADPLNTVTPSATGAVGLVPAYGILDINGTYRVSRQIQVKVNLNNVLNTQYFTKRPSFYPGPGIWPSDGRSVNASIGIKI